MTTSGSVISEKAKSSYFYIDWQLVNQNFANNTSTIAYQGGFVVGGGNLWYTNAIKIYSDGTTGGHSGTYSNATHNGKYQKFSGTFTVQHNSEGVANITIGISGWFYYYGNKSGYATFALPTIPKQTPVDVDGDTSNEWGAQLEYSYISQNIEQNYTTLSLTLKVYCPVSSSYNQYNNSAYYILQDSGKIYQKYSFTQGWHTIGSKLINIYHNDDGTKTTTLYGYWDSGIKTQLSVSKTVTLPTIPKKNSVRGTSICIMKKENNTYNPYYPKNHALNVDRQTKNISYIDGEDLLTTLQNTANMFIAPKGESFYSINLSNINDTSYMCGVDNFIAIFTPYNPDATHYMNMQVSYDGGKSWKTGAYYNSNTVTQINVILGAEAVQMSNGHFEVLLMGQANASSIEASSYKIEFSPTSSNVYVSVNEFSGSKIPLTV